MKKRVLSLALAAVLCSASLAGCESAVKDDEVLLTVNDTEITAGVANYFARFTQAQYETYYASYLGEDMWTQAADDDQTYEEMTKDSILKNIELMVLSEEKMDDYDVSITDEEKEKISGYAEQFLEDNSEEVNEKISASQENLERVLTLMLAESKVQQKIYEKADTNVSNEEAAQEAMSYVKFAFDSTDEDGNSVELTDEEKAELKKEAQKLIDDSKADPSKFSENAEAIDLNAADITFDADSDYLDAELLETALSMKEGEISDVIEGEDGYYVAYLSSEFDEDATVTKKLSIIEERQQDLYSQESEGWLDDAKIDVNESEWKKVSFTDLSVTIDSAEDEEAGD